jgi:TolB-like protein/Tfp pilus assembly protein PilF
VAAPGTGKTRRCHRIVTAPAGHDADRSGELDAAVSTASDLVELDALDEAAHRLLIECLARTGRRIEALQQFETCARNLRAELDVAPDPETVALADRLRAEERQRRTVTKSSALDLQVINGATSEARMDAPPLVTAFDAVPGWAGTTAMPSRRSRWHGAAWAAAVVGLVGRSAYVFTSRVTPLHPPGLMVAEFENVSRIPGQGGAVDGFADLVKASLWKIQYLRLTDGPRDKVTSGPTRDQTVLAAGGRYLLEGSATFATNDLHVTARLTDVRDDKELWSDRYDVPVSEVPRIADEIAIHAARAVAVALDRDIAAQSPVSPFLDGPRAAQELVSLGHLIDYSSPGTELAAQQIFRLALQFDQNNVDVLAHLAKALIKAAVSHDPVDQALLEEADTILAHAMHLDATNVFALFNGCLLRNAQGRIHEGMELCRRTLDIDPHYAGALREIGHDLLRSGEAEKAIKFYQASFDSAPYERWTYNALKGLGVASLALGRRDDAIAYLRKSMQLDAWNMDGEGVWLAAILEMGDGHAEAARLVSEFMERHPGFRLDKHYLALLSAPAYADRRDQVLAVLARVEHRQ